MDKNVVILAAGKCKSMNSIDPEHSKVSYPILGKPIINYVLDTVKDLNPNKIVVVVGFGGDVTKSLVENDADVVWQKEILGTGHAVLQTKELLQDKEGETLIIYGDTPLVAAETIQNVFKRHKKNKNDLTVVSAVLEDPTGYGRIVREHKSNKTLAIREEKSCTEDELYINEVNTGICVINNRLLFKFINKITNENKQGLYYLSELVEIFNEEGLRVDTFVAEDMREMFGINNRVQLAYADKVVRKRINNRLMMSGVSIEDPDSTYISPDVEIGRDTVIKPNTTIMGKCKIGEANDIGPNVYLKDVCFGNNNKITTSWLEHVVINDNEVVEPFTKIIKEK